MKQGGFETPVSREIRGSQEDAQNQGDIPRVIELGEKKHRVPFAADLRDD
jgi:hypothetical protein